MALTIPGFGSLEVEAGYAETPLVDVSALGREVSFLIDEDAAGAEDKVAECIANFRNAPATLLSGATRAACAYFEYVRAQAELDEDEDYLEELPEIAFPEEIWDYVEIADEVMIEPGSGEHDPCYVVLNADCEWEPEHGLCITLRNGNQFAFVGPNDGFLEWPSGLTDLSGDGLFRA